MCPQKVITCLNEFNHHGLSILPNVSTLSNLSSPTQPEYDFTEQNAPVDDFTQVFRFVYVLRKCVYN